MCMLTAMVPIRALSDEDIMLGKLLFASIILRNATSNRDGFGLASTDNTRFKTAEPAQKVMFDDFCITAVTNALPAPFIGHVRTTSTGRTAKDGSHPFFVGSLAVVHNGTFTNYRALLKDNADISTAIDDPDPVDSNVFAHLLGKVKGKDPLTIEDIETTIKEMRGSYAILVAEENQNFIWVVRGGNQLYQTTVGPYQVVNTSQINLTNAVNEVASTLKLLFNRELEVPKPELIPSYGIYKMWADGLTKQGDLPVPVTTVTTYNKDWAGTMGYKRATTLIPSETAIAGSRLASEITAIPGITYNELEIAANTLCETEWYKTRAEDLEVVQQTLEVLSTRHYTKEKAVIWSEIVKIVGSTPYESIENISTLIGNLDEVCFPWFLHTPKELQSILQRVRGGDNVIIS